MSQSNVPSFADLLANARRSAVHLEMRDVYAVGDETEEFERFKLTGTIDLDPTARWWPQWLGMVRKAVGRGVVMRRARIVSEPVTDYIRWEHAATPLNLDAGELVRWLPRRQSVDIALPGADFWLFDDHIVQFNVFTGDGDWADPPKEFSEDPVVVQLCASAFEAVWQRAIDHEKFAV
ncbi:DUF6879 family protein [Streptomyces litchfieldiae]|uniref:DUF6879 domain-containing protein n=1 Tax=Streptomyces litchfieldiae TaxID=3075543 RepID=A0ABU2MNA3_9ACTN|nr:DUF6879 family protein [Streptomyces sp. DSM 44938]MDT0343091.1 hypothetical protein [Streptomyces sp. DSM 44938]